MDRKVIIDYCDMEESKLEILLKCLLEIGMDKEAKEVQDLLDDCYFYGASN